MGVTTIALLGLKVLLMILQFSSFSQFRSFVAPFRGRLRENWLAVPKSGAKYDHNLSRSQVRDKIKQS